MSKLILIATIVCAAAMVAPLNARGVPRSAIQPAQHLTAQQAIATARRNAKPGSSFTVLKRIVATAETRRAGDEALKEAKTHHIKLFQKGILADVLRSGGFLIAGTDPRTHNVLYFHLVSLGPDGTPEDALFYCGGINLADAKVVAKDTAEFIHQFYSTPSFDVSSLESRFYGGSFPECSQLKSGFDACTLFAIPRYLLKLGADPSEVREVAALTRGFVTWQFRYAVSMPVFAASPVAAIRTTDGPITEFMRKNHMAPDFDFDPENIKSKEQLRERIDLLRRLDEFLEALLKNRANPAIVKANVSVATIPLGLGSDTDGHEVLYGSTTASLLVIYWQRLPTGGFAVKYISEADVDGD